MSRLVNASSSVALGPSADVLPNRFRIIHTAAVPLALLLLGIVVHLTFLISLGAGMLNGLFNDSMHRFGPGCDFFSIYAAGVKARLGESVYTIGGRLEQVPYAYAFRYAPVAAYTLGLALSWLPHLTAYGVWLCLCELALLRNIRLTMELSRPRITRMDTSLPIRNGDDQVGDPGLEARSTVRSRVREVFAHPYSLAALWLLFSPYYLELYVGQFTFITTSLVFWAYVSWPSGSANPDQSSSRSGSHPIRTSSRPSHTGKSPFSRVFACFAGKSLGDLAWAAAVLLKMMPLLFLPIALLRGRWKSAVATVAVLAVSSWVYFQRFPADWRVFTDTNADLHPTWHAGNQGLMALLYALSGERVAVYLVYRNFAIALVGVLLAWLTYRAWRGPGAGGQGPGKMEGVAAASPLLHYSTTPLLVLYAAASAGYLLCYKDVWEHHYVLLLPPLVLLALRRESPWLWLPPFLVSALPTLFALYDVPGIGYNEDPQRYWVPSVSLLHHAWKPVAPLWLTAGIAISALKMHHGDTETRRRNGNADPRGLRVGNRVMAPAAVRARRWFTACLALCLCVSAVSLLVIQAAAAIREQRAVTREVIWSEDVFQKQVQRENCGPAALAAVCRHYGIAAREGEMAGLAGTTLRGTPMLGLQRAAEAKGLAASARRVSPAELRSLPRPCLLFFHEGHFAVLTGVQGQSFYVADPSLGQRVWPEAYLRRYWRGEVLLLGPSEARAIPTSH